MNPARHPALPPRRTTFLALTALCAGLLACTPPPQPEPGTLTVLLEAVPRTLDPRFATADVDVKVSRLVFSGLVTNDTADGRPEPDLAAEVREEPPGTWTVSLRPDARWHDGAPVTSADVAYTFGQLDHPNVRSPFAGAFRDVDIEVIDPLTIVFRLPEPSATFLGDLDRGLVPHHVLHERGRFDGMDPVGAGPWRFVEQQRDGTVVLARAQAPGTSTSDGEGTSANQLLFRPVADDNSRLLTLLAGAADLTLNTVSPLMLPVLDRDDDLVVERSPSFKYTYLAFNLEHPVLSDLRVRQAVALAIDREEIIRYKFRGTATLARNMIPPAHWAAASDARAWLHDPEAARRLLDEAGLTADPVTGCRTSLTFKTSANRFRRSVAAVMAAQLTEVGLCTRVQSFEWGTFFEDIRSGNFELTTLQWPSVTDPDILRWVFHSSNIPDAERRGAGGNRGRYRNERVDALLDAGRREGDEDRRAEIYREVQRILAEDLPYVSLWHEENLVVRRRDVIGFEPTPNARFPALLQTRRVLASPD